MNFDLQQASEILERTPITMRSLLFGISDPWIFSNEGDDTWSPYDVMGHLIHGENTDWIPRVKIILAQGENTTFEPFDRLAQFKQSKGKSLQNLLDEFEMLRNLRLAELKSLRIEPKHLRLRGRHPGLGEVTLEQLLAAWVTHDLTHIVQVARVMARQYQDEVGPWKEYIGALRS